MIKKTLRMVVSLLLIVFLFGSSGCILSSDKNPPRPPENIDWKDRTEREHCVDILLLTYKHRNIERYKELLHSDYVWYMQEEDVLKGYDHILTRDQDIEGTERIFDAHSLELSLYGSGWDVWTPEVGTCDNCWTSTRTYTISVQFESEGSEYQGIEQQVIIVVVPDETDPSKYQILQAYDQSPSGG